MSDVKLLLKVAEDMRSLADSIQAVADAMLQSESPAESPVSDTPTAPAEKPVSLEEVRATLSVKSQDGKCDAVRALLQKYGANKLSAVDPANYRTLLADAEVL